MTQDTPLSIALAGVAVASLVAAAAISWKMQTTLDRRYVRRALLLPILKRMNREINELRKNQQRRGIEFTQLNDDEDDEEDEAGEFV